MSPWRGRSRPEDGNRRASDLGTRLESESRQIPRSPCSALPPETRADLARQRVERRDWFASHWSVALAGYPCSATLNGDYMC